ncbi:Possible RNA methyltransferase aq_898 [hydrothermal vent metagenome]|uniref:Possible RNA methyltransferase aq_898 n=1 Tax=hydrothermal vent metagenome TaxID=652676 RepID=A0A3B1DJ00_9ZZZZ
MGRKLQQKPIKAVGLISGGLDSTLACKVIKDLGVDVYGVYFAMPWGCCNKTKALEAAEHIGIKFISMQLDERYLEIIRNPKHGHGSALNPCVDCRIHMFSRAAQYMKHIGADFIFTGEVLGQRPMSQQRHSMKWIEEGVGIEGRLLRPLSAQLLEPTIPEKEGLIDREKLLRISGRSRRDQMQFCKNLDVSQYTQPAGGCLLTDQHFARRMKDTLKYGYRNFRETVALQWGRHFRINDNFKATLGRKAEENESLLRYVHPDDYVMELQNKKGPTLILKGYKPTEEILSIAAGLIQYFSKFKNNNPEIMNYYLFTKKNIIKNIIATKLEESKITAMQI